MGIAPAGSAEERALSERHGSQRERALSEREGSRRERGARRAARPALARMRWWHVAEVMVLERELFGDETWSEAAFWNELAETGTRHYVVALDRPGGPGGPDGPDGAAGDRVVGYAGLAVHGDEAHVLTIGVARAAQGRGIGRALLLDLLAAAGHRRVLLDVRADNEAAQRLYRRHGFVPVGRRRRYYQPSGVDAVVMARG